MVIPAPSFSTVQQTLNLAFHNRYTDHRDGHLVGFLFAPYAAAMAQEYIWPNLSELNNSSRDVDIFFPGYEAYMPPGHAGRRLRTITGPDLDLPWTFNDAAFDTFVAEFESVTSWRRSESVQLLLLNATFTPSDPQAYLDFSKAMILNVMELVTDHVIASPLDLVKQTIRSDGPTTPAVEGFRSSRLHDIWAELVGGNSQDLSSRFCTAWRANKHYVIRDIRP